MLWSDPLINLLTDSGKLEARRPEFFLCKSKSPKNIDNNNGGPENGDPHSNMHIPCTLPVL